MGDDAVAVRERLGLPAEERETIEKMGHGDAFRYSAAAGRLMRAGRFRARCHGAGRPFGVDSPVSRRQLT